MRSFQAFRLPVAGQLPGWTYRPREHAENPGRLVDHLGLDRVDLLVHDWGGPIGLGWASANPERIGRIVALDTWMWSMAKHRAARIFSGLMGSRLGQWATSSGPGSSVDRDHQPFAQGPRFWLGSRVHPGTTESIGRTHLADPKAPDRKEFEMAKGSVVIAGVGHASGVGAAVARRFAREGFRVTIFGRNAEKLESAEASLRKIGDGVTVVVGDVTDERSVTALVASADTNRAPLEVAIFNAGGNWPKRYLEMDGDFLEAMWRVNALAGLFFSQAAIRAMLPRQRGTIIFTGATGSMRGKAGFGGFASSKAALRMLAQSCAREFGPAGLHVAHVVIDGAVDGDRINRLMPKLKDKLGEEGLLDPDAIAENYWNLHCQKRSAWTQELDLRPWSENW